MEDLKYIGKKIRQLAEEKNKSLRDIAAETGLSVATVYLAIKHPQNRTLKVLQKIANALGVSLQELFTPQD